MQPYFLPYIGYFQLIQHADVFVLYDDAEYTKKGWINRNRILVEDRVQTISIPIKSGSDFLSIRERSLAANFSPDKLFNQLKAGYQRCTNWTTLSEYLNDVLFNPDRCLFTYIDYSIKKMLELCGLATTVLKSSEIEIDYSLRRQERVIAICQALGAQEYVNPVGGFDLYDPTAFRKAGVNLKFLRARLLCYPQKSTVFVPALSIIDMFANTSIAYVQEAMRTEFDVISA